MTHRTQRRIGWCQRGTPSAWRKPLRRRDRPLKSAASGRALLADCSEFLLVVDLRSVLYEKTTDAGELIRLGRKHHNIEIEIRQISTGQLEAAGVVRVVDVNNTRHLVWNAFLQSLDRIRVVVGLARGVVVGRHAHPLLILGR